MSDRHEVPVIDLSKAPGSRSMWGQPAWKVYAWKVAELLFVTNHWQPSSKIRSKVLRKFGAQIGEGVIMRPGLRVKFPWKLSVGDRSWLGEDVWFSNEGHVTVGSDVVISQGTFVTSGSHDFRNDMALIAKPVVIDDGVWITAKCVVLPGTHVGRATMATPGAVLRGSIPPNSKVGTAPNEIRSYDPTFETPDYE